MFRQYKPYEEVLLDHKTLLHLPEVSVHDGRVLRAELRVFFVLQVVDVQDAVRDLDRTLFYCYQSNYLSIHILNLRLLSGAGVLLPSGILVIFRWSSSLPSNQLVLVLVSDVSEGGPGPTGLGLNILRLTKQLS